MKHQIYLNTKDNFTIRLKGKPDREGYCLALMVFETIRGDVLVNVFGIEADPNFKKIN